MAMPRWYYLIKTKEENMANIQLRLDDELKNKADELFKDNNLKVSR